MDYFLSVAVLVSTISLTFAQVGPDEKTLVWGRHISWILDTEEAIEIATTKKKPIMMIVHREWCAACKRLAPQFAASKAIQDMSKSFVMVNHWEDSEPWQDEYQPDGKYVPRFMFLYSDGSLMKEIASSQHGKAYKYYYEEVDPIVHTMRKVLEKFKSTNYAPPAKKEL